MSDDNSLSLHCADVRTLGIAQSHNTSEDRTLSRTSSAHCEQTPRTLPAQSENTTSLKALASAVLGASLQCANVRTHRSAQSHNTSEDRTLSRTSSAHCEQTPRTLPAHCQGTAAHYQKPETEQEELTRLVRFCGEAYGFTPHEHIEALAVALADFEAALTCFRTMEIEITGASQNPAHMGTTTTKGN